MVPWYIILFAILFFIEYALIISLFVVKPTKAEVKEIPKGAPGIPGKNGVTYPPPKDGAKGDKGDQGVSGSTFDVVSVTFTPITAQDAIQMIVTPAIYPVCRGVTAGGPKVTFLTFENIPVRMMNANNGNFYLRFTLPNPMANTNISNIIAGSGYVNTVNVSITTQAAVLVLYISTVIVNVTTIRCRFASVRGPIWDGTGQNPILYCYLNLQYLRA
jgi:hypothetical protein